ncbi:MotA/TolQ/ExbB proton channel family protein [Aliifodinibius sp. S!AR15-10]|uniref:motility protein A n=1 Tax=Aliifodinibius sp. S!AR15-10 TaxID=2950437 RepID=UPI00286709A5|nr:MotA/TolQ/ExbB proton channel family protein [Aliifodinibius sp. S!AR15-10]MDR8394248.1 MotA/TolQ/ExbB proton channel family protein [Aliifodinibius sp. S!AR15-10]
MLDRSTVIGLLFGFTLILVAIVTQGNLLVFASLSSLLIVVGGIVAATMVNYSLKNIKNSFTTISSLMGVKSVDLRTDMELMSMFARRVRSEGLLVLEGDIEHIKDPYLRNGLQFAVDGFKQESLASILQNEIQSRKRQVEISIKVLQSMSNYAPAFGMIGTIIGMVLMLQNVSDPESLGSGLSVALLTTLYGTIFSNMLFGPLAGKLDYLSKLDLNRKEMFRVGIMSMMEKENPRIMEKKMLIYINPKDRAEYIKHHEELTIKRQRDQKLYSQWIEQQNNEWETLKKVLEPG